MEDTFLKSIFESLAEKEAVRVEAWDVYCRGGRHHGAHGVILCHRKNRVDLRLAVIASRPAFRVSRVLDGQRDHTSQATPSSQNYRLASPCDRGLVPNDGRHGVYIS